ncbi:hypothetical protein CCY99_05745 [Helicobacter sp. 16-1353]|uniref:hypothetical protein n=1 Tax=Helicobacter sp. 16-1353 TaxID=2004996 RepID=UPI000DCD4807|nr:hypothetical protein [Helicobacter sp. 16-1353]RAX53883.1 hypothetical protein CCY99_05745 [Helicobacter sp. 16-1353]
MTFKYYPLTILILGVLLGFYIYNIDSSSFSYTIPFTNLTYNMPVALWIVLIVYIFFFITIAFIFSERLGRFIDRNAIKNDKRIFVRKIKNKIIEREEDKLILKTKLFKELGNIIDGLNITPKPHITNCENQEIKKLFAMYENLQNGEEIDIHKFNIPQTSTLFTINAKNSINKNYKNGLSIIKNKNYIYELKKFAFIALLRNADEKEIEKYKDQISYDKEIALEMIKIYINGKIHLSVQEISDICKNAKFTEDDYLNIIKSAKGKINPNQWIEISEYLADNDENAEKAHFYVLLELEMLERAKNRLKAQPTYEFLNIRAYLDLKAAGKTYPTELFFK